MNKDFVPYKESLKLKELGFDEPCLAINNGDKLFYGAFKSTHSYYKENAVILYQQAFRWFREKYNFDSSINRVLTENKTYHFNVFADKFYGSIEYNTYEEAELACLRQLIEIAKPSKRNV